MKRGEELSCKRGKLREKKAHFSKNLNFCPKKNVFFPVKNEKVLTGIKKDPKYMLDSQLSTCALRNLGAIRHIFFAGL